MAKEHPIKIIFYGSEKSGASKLMEEVAAFLEGKGLRPKVNSWKGYLTLPEDYSP